MRLTLETDADLRRALALASWLDRPAVSHVEVRLPGLGPVERDRSARAIRKLFNDCGCVVSTVAMVATAVVLAVAGAGADWSWWRIGVATLVCLAAAIAGKVLALAASGWRLRIRLRHLAAVGILSGLGDTAGRPGAG